MLKSPSHSKNGMIWLVIIALFYVCAGIIALKSHAVLSEFERDGTEMLFDAERIFNGQGYNSDFWPFGYMASIAFVKLISGMDYFTSAKAITLFAGTGVLFMTFFIAREVFSGKTAILAVLLLATNHFFFFHSFLVEMDMLYTFLFLLSIYFLVRADEWRDYFLSGALAGISYMVKYGSYALFPVVVVVALIGVADKGIVDSIKKIMIYFVAFFLFSSPWLINNKIKNGSPFYSKHHVNIAWGMNRPKTMNRQYWGEYFRLNREYPSMKAVIADTDKFLRNWAGNIRDLPVGFSSILSAAWIFLLPAFFMLFRDLDRRRLILFLVAIGYMSLVTMAYTWDRYLLPLMPIFCMLIAYCIYEIIPETFSLKKIFRGVSFNITYRMSVVSVLVLLALIKSYGMVNGFLRDLQVVEYRIAGEWLKEKLKKDDWIMVPRPQLAWYAGTDRMVKYPVDDSLPFEDVVKMREQNSFFFWHETLDHPIVTDVDYVIYDEIWWKEFFPSLMSDNGPVVPDNFVPVFSTKGAKTHIIIYRVIDNAVDK